MVSAALGALVLMGCGVPVGPHQILVSVDELPAVPLPDQLSEFDRNVQEGLQKRLDRLARVIQRTRLSADSEGSGDGSEGADGQEGESAARRRAATGPAVHAVARAFSEIGDFAFAYRIDETARVAYANAALLEPMEPRWPYFSGLLAARAGDQAEAVDLLERALRLDPLNDELVLAWTEQRLEGESLDGLEGRLRGLLDLEPDHAVALLRLGDLLQRQGRLEEARSVLRRAHESDPRAGDVRYLLAQVLRDEGEVEEAEELLRGVAVGDPASRVRVRRPWFDRVAALQRGVPFLQRAGEAAYRAGQLQIALARFSEAVELAPENPMPQLNRLLLLIEVGDVEGALEQRERLRAMTPDHRQLLFLSGLLEGLQGNQDKAMRELRASIAADAGYVAPRLELARWSFRSGDLTEGRRQFEAVLQAEPENDAARVQWMLAEATFGDPQQGCALLPDPSGGPVQASLASVAARLLATEADHCGRDASWGVRLARALYERERDVYTAETVAMTLMGAGRTDSALRVQSQVVQQLSRAKRTPKASRQLAQATARLQDYSAGRFPSPAWTDDELRDLGFLTKRVRSTAPVTPLEVGAPAAEELG